MSLGALFMVDYPFWSEPLLVACGCQCAAAGRERPKCSPTPASHASAIAYLGWHMGRNHLDASAVLACRHAGAWITAAHTGGCGDVPGSPRCVPAQVCRSGGLAAGLALGEVADHAGRHLGVAHVDCSAIEIDAAQWERRCGKEGVSSPALAAGSVGLHVAAYSKAGRASDGGSRGRQQNCLTWVALVVDDGGANRVNSLHHALQEVTQASGAVEGGREHAAACAHASSAYGPQPRRAHARHTCAHKHSTCTPQGRHSPPPQASRHAAAGSGLPPQTGGRCNCRQKSGNVQAAGEGHSRVTPCSSVACSGTAHGCEGR